MSSKSGKTILLVEDDAAIIDTLTMFLRYEGYEVLKARSVGRALEVLETTCPDLVLLDYMLQDDTGDRVVAFARRKYGYDTKIMLLTAVDDAEGR
ncbi:MAG: response regulator, partial [Deltaproteobacteria bacterium]|nr:response regulator [Deltaproteobacteria bacterium]